MQTRKNNLFFLTTLSLASPCHTVNILGYGLNILGCCYNAHHAKKIKQHEIIIALRAKELKAAEARHQIAQDALEQGQTALKLGEKQLAEKNADLDALQKVYQRQQADLKEAQEKFQQAKFFLEKSEQELFEKSNQYYTGYSLAENYSAYA